jgi:hypothetical protein
MLPHLMLCHARTSAMHMITMHIYVRRNETDAVTLIQNDLVVVVVCDVL